MKKAFGSLQVRGNNNTFCLCDFFSKIGNDITWLMGFLHSVPCSYFHHFPSLIPVTQELLQCSHTCFNGQEYRSVGPGKSSLLCLIYFHLWGKTLTLAESKCFQRESHHLHFARVPYPLSFSALYVWTYFRYWAETELAAVLHSVNQKKKKQPKKPFWEVPWTFLK